MEIMQLDNLTDLFIEITEFEHVTRVRLPRSYTPDSGSVGEESLPVIGADAWPTHQPSLPTLRRISPLPGTILPFLWVSIGPENAGQTEACPLHLLWRSASHEQQILPAMRHAAMTIPEEK